MFFCVATQILSALLVLLLDTRFALLDLCGMHQFKVLDGVYLLFFKQWQKYYYNGYFQNSTHFCSFSFSVVTSAL